MGCFPANKKGVWFEAKRKRGFSFRWKENTCFLFVLTRKRVDLFFFDVERSTFFYVLWWCDGSYFELIWWFIQLDGWLLTTQNGILVFSTYDDWATDPAGNLIDWCLTRWYDIANDAKTLVVLVVISITMAMFHRLWNKTSTSTTLTVANPTAKFLDFWKKWKKKSNYL